MYTRCPHCTTIFRITAEQLRAAHSEIPCVTCAQPFNALDSLSDDITALIGTEDTADETPVESMEFDAPEQTWTRFFLNSDASGSTHDDGDGRSLELQTADQDEWQEFLVELKDDESEIPIIPAWLGDELPDELSEQRQAFRPSWSVLGVCTALALLLAGQLIHYNRDALAASDIYGATIRQAYALYGAQLYPEWPLDAFAVTGTEAITGRSRPDALDILANVIVGGRQPVGLPLIRVILHDRWATPVASRVFTPAEYLRGFSAETLLVSPGAALPVDISVADPGTKALSYVVDVCLPRRKTGLDCQIDLDPFQ